MKKIIKITLLFSMIGLLLACNIPGMNSGAEEAQSNPDQVETKVAQTFTAQTAEAVSQNPATEEPIQPPADEATQTQTFTQAPENTPTETATPENTPTETATLTATVPVDNPRQNLGNPTWQNLLDSGASFGLDATGYEDDTTRIRVQNGMMELTSFSAHGYHGWRLTSQTPKNMYFEGVFKTESCSGNDQYGLVFRAPDYGSGAGYYLGLTCLGSYNLMKWTDSGTSMAINATSHSAIKSGPGQTNRLGVMANGESLKIYINDELVGEVNDSSITEAGHIGAFVAGYSPTTLTVYLDEISYWNLP